MLKSLRRRSSSRGTEPVADPVDPESRASAWNNSALRPPSPPSPPSPSTSGSSGSGGHAAASWPAPVRTIVRDPSAPSVIVVVADDPDVVAVSERVVAERSTDWRLHVTTDDPTLRALVVDLPALDVFVASARLGAGDTRQLFEHVRQRSPETARVVLCDPGERSGMVWLSELAHQQLPGLPEAGAFSQLVQHVRRATRTELLDPVRSLVGHVDRLPSPPAMYQRLAEIMSTADWSIHDLAEELSSDVALTGELLKLVNSSFYGTASMVSSVSQAISLLGIDTTKVVVLGNKVFESDAALESWIDLDRLATRSKAVASGARALAQRCGDSTEQASAAYLTGMVSEIGLLVLARIPNIAPSIAAPVNVSVYPGAERALFGGDRFEVGAHLLTLWGFAQPVAEAVRCLSNGDPCAPGELAWYLMTSRQLVLGDGFEPDALINPPGAMPELDDAIGRLRNVIEGTNAPSPDATA